MQIKHRKFQKDGAGSIKIIADDDEDIWHVYNLVMAGDEVHASTSRKVQVRTGLARSQTHLISTKAQSDTHFDIQLNTRIS
jgi:protein pelota